jgi:hypothetical protein
VDDPRALSVAHVESPLHSPPPIISYFSDLGANVIRRLSPAAGGGFNIVDVVGRAGTGNTFLDVSAPTASDITAPSYIAVAASGAFFFAERGACRGVEFSAAGSVCMQMRSFFWLDRLRRHPAGEWPHNVCYRWRLRE